MATVGHDGVARCTDVRTGGQQKDGVLKAIQTDAPLTCGSFHHEVCTWKSGGGSAAEAVGGAVPHQAGWCFRRRGLMLGKKQTKKTRLITLENQFLVNERCILVVKVFGAGLCQRPEVL